MTKLTGLLSIDSKSIPSRERPNIIKVLLMTSDVAWGMATDEPIPVVVRSSLSKSELIILSFSSFRRKAFLHK